MTAITNNSSIEINVVIIGETGTGKSTLVNYLTNLFHNGSLTNLKIAIPTRYLPCNMSSIMPQHHENYLDDSTCSKTSQCTKYQFIVKQVQFNFIDTPGYLADDESIDQIFQYIQSLEYLSAFVLVLNGTQPRLTINIKNILERFRDHIPDLFYSNMIVILSHCTSHTVNVDSVKLLNHASIFHMQNSAFSSDPQTWSTHTREMLQGDWNVSIRTMNEFIKTLILLTPVSTKSLEEMDNDRNVIRSVLHESRLMIIELQHIEDELTALEQATYMYSAENDAQAKTIQVNEVTITPYHNTICLQCNTVCHERCSLAETTQIGERAFRHCIIMDNGQCTVCSGKCPYDMHYHDRRLIKCVPRIVRFAISTLSNEDHETERDKAVCEIQYKTVQERKRLIEQALQEQFNKVRDACLRVQNNCQGFNVAGELCIFVNLLKNDMNSFKSSSLINQVTRFIEKLEMLANASPITLSKQSSPSATKRKIRTSNRNQSKTKSTARNDNLILINHSPTSSLITHVDNIPPQVSIIEDDSFTHVQIAQQPTSDYSNSRKYAEYPTEQLIALTREKVDKYMLIGKELNRRCEGTSMGYLSSIQLLTLCEYYSSSLLLQSDELVRLHTQLRLEIQQLIDSNPFEILSVPIQKLLHLTAVTLCLQNIDKYE